MPGVRRLTEKIGRGVREGQLPSSPCMSGRLDLLIYRRLARLSIESRASVEFRRWDPSWIPGFPFGLLPFDRPEVSIVLFEMPELGTILSPPAPALQLEALVERSYSACYKYPSHPPFSLGLVFF
jgi:hypothetical protein